MQGGRAVEHFARGKHFCLRRAQVMTSARWDFPCTSGKLHGGCRIGYRASDVFPWYLHLQDLSMGWLDCNPDELFLPTRFTVRDLPHYTPGPVENFLIGVSHITPKAVMRALDVPLSVSFIARPMQVAPLLCCDYDQLALKHGCLPCPIVWSLGAL